MNFNDFNILFDSNHLKLFETISYIRKKFLWISMIVQHSAFAKIFIMFAFAKRVKL